MGWGSGLPQARPVSWHPSAGAGQSGLAGAVWSLPLLFLQLLFGHHLLVLVSPQLPGAVFKGEDLSPCREETRSELARGSECWGPPPDSGSSSPFVSFKRAISPPMPTQVLPGLREEAMPLSGPSAQQV